MKSRFELLLFCITLVMVSGLSSAVTVDEGFVVDSLIGQIDGHAFRLEAIRNHNFGNGVIAACMDNGILKVMRISQSSVDIINVESGFDPISIIGDIRFDTSGLFSNDSNDLFVTVWTNSTGSDWKQSSSTYLMRVPADGPIEEVGYYGDTDNKLLFMLDFTAGTIDYAAGCYLADYAYAHGTSFYHLDTDYQLTNLTNNVLPANRFDLDPRGMEFDRTGNYNEYLTIADGDDTHDDVSAIYQLEPNVPGPDFVWSTFVEPNNVDTIFYQDMCFSTGGSFGESLYVTDSVSETVMIVEPNGVHTVFASGFIDIQSVTISEDGECMYVSDSNSIHRIRSQVNQPGPTIVMQEPALANGGVFTDPNGIMSLKLSWSEALIFNNSDVSILDELSQPVEFSVCGSGSDFMIIVFERPLLYDKFIITIADTVVSEKRAIAIDGDGDELAGGDAVIVMEHRLREDTDNSNRVDIFDLSGLAAKWLWSD